VNPARCWWSTSAAEGSCNFCHAHVTHRGVDSHAVLVVASAGNGGPRVRLCRACACALVEAFLREEPAR
jgi:hypothetical protein